MRFSAFMRKEIMEILRTSKIILLPSLFLFFGILSPVTAKYTNQILAMVGEQQGIKITLPDPTYIQSYEQLFKNLYFMMIIIVILVFAGSVAEEKSKGTVVLVLTKCLTRVEFIFGKITAAILLFTFSYLISAAVCVLYTGLLFKVFLNEQIVFAILLYWLFGLFVLSFTFLASIVLKSYTTAAVGGFSAYVTFSVLASIPYVKDYTPGILQELSLKIIAGAVPMKDALIPVVITIALTLAFSALGIQHFKKQEI